MSVNDLDFDVLDIQWFSHFPDNIAPFSTSGVANTFAFVDTGHVGVLQANVAVTATPTIVGTSTNTATAFINLQGRVSRVYTKFYIPSLPTLAADNWQLNIGWDNFQTAGSSYQLLAQVGINNTAPLTLSFISTIAGTTTTLVIPASTFTNSIGAFSIATWYELDILIADKASVLSSIVATTSVPNAVLANTNQFGAYLRMRKEAVSGQFAGQWAFMGKFDMSFVPTASQVHGGLKAIKPGAGTVNQLADVDFLYIEVERA